MCACEQYLVACACSHSTSPLSLIHGSRLLSSVPTRAFTSSSVHSLPHSLHPCAFSQGAETFLPSALLVSGGPHPLLLYLPLSFLFPSFILQWPLCPVLLKLAFLSFIHPSISQRESVSFPFSSHQVPARSLFPSLSCGLVVEDAHVGCQGSKYVFVEYVCVCVSVCVCVGMLGYWWRGGWVGVSALLASSCGSLIPDARPYAAPPL